MFHFEYMLRYIHTLYLVRINVIQTDRTNCIFTYFGDQLAPTMTQSETDFIIYWLLKKLLDVESLTTTKTVQHSIHN